MNTNQTVQTDDEITHVKTFQKKLKGLLIKKDLDKLIDENYFKVAAEKQNTSRAF